MTSITIHAGVTSIGNRCFLSNSKLTTADIKSLTLPEYCFLQCSALRQVILPEGMTSIAGHVFESCSSLVIDLPQSIISIGESAFSGCKSISEFVIPEKVTTIGNNAFNGCNMLKTIYSYPVNAPTIMDSTFNSGSNVSNCELIVKAGSTGYESGYWANVIAKYTLKYTL